MITTAKQTFETENDVLQGIAEAISSLKSDTNVNPFMEQFILFKNNVFIKMYSKKLCSRPYYMAVYDNGVLQKASVVPSNSKADMVKMKSLAETYLRCVNVAK